MNRKTQFSNCLKVTAGLGMLTSTRETESTALSASLDKPCPFVFKLSSLYQHDLAYRKLTVNFMQGPSVTFKRCDLVIL